jgi:hypothetical protein
MRGSEEEWKSKNKILGFLLSFVLLKWMIRRLTRILRILGVLLPKAADFKSSSSAIEITFRQPLQMAGISMES